MYEDEYASHTINGFTFIYQLSIQSITVHDSGEHTSITNHNNATRYIIPLHYYESWNIVHCLFGPYWPLE